MENRDFKDTIVVNRSGIGFMGVLFITFLVLRLTNVIAWSWWWITAPLWGPFAFIALMFIMFLVVSAIISILDR